MGVQRITKLVKYLPQNGWKPVVVTIPRYGSKAARDPKLEDAIPQEAEIIRPFYLDYRRFIPGDIAKLFRKIEKEKLYPDKFVIWNYFVKRKINYVVNHFRPDIVFVNVNPFSSLLLAADLKKMTGLPVVVNFRDPFSFNNYLITEKDFAESKRALELEQKLFQNYDAIVCVTPFATNTYRKLFPQMVDRIYFIPNGFDPEDFEDVAPAKPETFTIGYNGSISSLVPIAPILEAIHHIYREHGIRIKLNIASANRLRDFRSHCPECFDEGLAEHKGFLSHSESLENLARSHLLLAMFAKNKSTEGAYPGKIFEYLAMKKPILLLNHPESDLAKLVLKTKSGTVVDIENHEEIVKTLLMYHEKWQKDEWAFSQNEEAVKQYDYRVITKKTTELFDEVLSK